MKVTITTLTGEKFGVEVTPEDTVKYVKGKLYQEGKVTSVMRLLHGQTVLRDHRKLSEYNITQDGTVISALFEPDVDINIEVSTGQQTSQLVVPNSTSVMALKVQLFDVISCGIVPDKMEVLFGDVNLENTMPLHYYGLTNGSKVVAVKPYITVSVEDNHGDILCKRLSKKDTIGEVKVKLSTTIRSPSPPPIEEPPAEGPGGHFLGRRGHHHHHGHHMRMRHFWKRNKAATVAKHASLDDMRLYVVRGKNQAVRYEELIDDMAVADYKLKDNDNLYLLSYKWTNQTSITVVNRSGMKILGVEPDDTFTSVKVRAQDQLGVPFTQVVLQHNLHPASENVKISSVVKQYPICINVV